MEKTNKQKHFFYLARMFVCTYSTCSLLFGIKINTKRVLLVGSWCLDCLHNKAYFPVTSVVAHKQIWYLNFKEILQKSIFHLELQPEPNITSFSTTNNSPIYCVM